MPEMQCRRIAPDYKVTGMSDEITDDFQFVNELRRDPDCPDLAYPVDTHTH